MAKQLNNQKLILKINSKRLRRNGWDLEISLSQAIRNSEIISLGSSQTLRFIDEIKDNEDIDEKINDVKNKIQKMKKEKNNKKNRAALPLLYKDMNNLKYIPDYICVIVDTKADFNKLNGRQGFKIKCNNDGQYKNYKRLVGTTGGIKNRTIVYASEDLYEEVNKRIDNGRNMNIPMIPAKLEAYRALSCSMSVPVTNTHNVIVVPDAFTKFTEDVIKIHDGDLNSDRPILEYVNDYELELNCSDGFGLITPEMALQWAKDVGESYLPSGFCIRNSFCKGMLFTFDFKEFAEKVAGSYIVKDVWGNEQDIRKADIILTESMLKLWSSYDSIEHYFKCCDENKYTFAITKIVPEVLDEERATNYQYLQSYNFTDADIEELTKPTIDAIKASIGRDYAQTLLFLRGMKITSANAFEGESDYVKALMVESKLLNDPFVKSKILNMREKRIREAKTGILDVKGNYTMLSGDPYALCQSMFGMEVTGILKANQVYNNFWLKKGDKEIVIFRSPMSCHNNIRNVNICDYEEAKYWFRYMPNVTILSCWDSITQALNGCDFDGDLLFSTNNPVLLYNTEKTRAIICQQNTSKKIIVKERDLMQSNKDGFDDGIGKTTNRISTMFELLPLFDKKSPEYKELEYRIMCGQHYQQCEIDKIKGIKSNPMPKEWYNSKMLVIREDDSDKIKTMKEFNRKIVTDKKPYFFIHIYPYLKRKYDEFKKNMIGSARLRFNKDYTDILNNPTNIEEEKFVAYYNYNCPVFEYDSTMNRICRHVEKELDKGILKEVDEKFDFNILKSDMQYSQTAYKNIKNIYAEYNLELKAFKKANAYERENDDNEMVRNMLKEDFKAKCYNECSNEEELCNILVDMCYKSNKSKQLVWDICGEQIIYNLLIKNNYIIKYPHKHESGDIEFNGERFELVSIKYEV